jgi:hypothetical protein
MEQKTEASQAVDERQSMMEALSMCIDALDGDAGRKQREFAQGNAARVLGGAALKAKPVISESAVRDMALDEASRACGAVCVDWNDAGDQAKSDAAVYLINVIHSLKVQPAPTEAQGLSPVYAWLERSTQSGVSEVEHAARTMMAFYQGAEFPEAAQGEDSARLDASDDRIEALGLMHVSPNFIGLWGPNADYKNTELFARLKAYTHDLLKGLGK